MSRVLQQKKEQVYTRELTEAEHFSRLEQIKTDQLKQLSQL